MKTQRMVEKALGTNDKILINCKYNTKFKKFVPCGIPKEGTDEPSQFLDVSTYVNSI